MRNFLTTAPINIGVNFKNYVALQGAGFFIGLLVIYGLKSSAKINKTGEILGEIFVIFVFGMLVLIPEQIVTFFTSLATYFLSQGVTP